MLLRTMVFVSLGFVVFSCSGDDGTPRKELTPEVQKYIDAIFNPVSLLISGDAEALTNIVFTTEGIERATIAFNDYADSATGLTLKGELSLTNVVGNSTASLSVKGPITFSDGIEVAFDVVFVLPWDKDGEGPSGPPTSVSGAVTVDGSVYSAKEYVLFAFEDNGNDDDKKISDPRFVVATMTGAIVYSASGEQWGYPNVATAEDIGSTEELRGIGCNDDGECLAVGNQGVILRSTDGTNWSLVESGSDKKLWAVAWGGGTWIVLGDGLTVLRSDDRGLSWSAVDTGITRNPLALAYSGSQWVVTGDAGMIFTSSDLDTWTDASFQTGAPLRGVATNGDGTWVAIAESDFPLVSHDDAASWERSSWPGDQPDVLRGVSFGGGRFVAVGWNMTTSAEVVQPHIYVSENNGDGWVQKDLSADYMSRGRGLVGVATDGNGRWSVFGNYGDHLLSTDGGDSWTTIAVDKYGGWGNVAFRP